MHLQHLGFPIVDDPIYGPAPFSPAGQAGDISKPGDISKIGDISKTGDSGDDALAVGGCGWEVDSTCPHCPSVEPVAEHGSGGQVRFSINFHCFTTVLRLF